MRHPYILPLLGLLLACTAGAVPVDIFNAFNFDDPTFSSQGGGFNTKAMFGSSSSFFDPALDDLFSEDFSDYGIDDGFTLNGVCDSFCQEARKQVSQFEQDIRNFEAQYIAGDSQASFPGVAGGGTFSSTGPRAVATVRPTVHSARPQRPAGPSQRPRTQPTPFTSFPRITARAPTPVTRRPPASRRPTVRRPRPTTVVQRRDPAPTLRAPRPTRGPAATPSPAPEQPKAATLPPTAAVTEPGTGRPAGGGAVSWSFNGESLDDESPGREGRTASTVVPTPGPSDGQGAGGAPSGGQGASGGLPIDSYFSPGDPRGAVAGRPGQGTDFRVFDAVPK